MKYLASLLALTLCNSVNAAEQTLDPSVPIPVVYPQTPQMVATSGVWFGRGWTRGPLKLMNSGSGSLVRYTISVEGDLEPTPETLLLEQTRFLKKPLPPSDRLTFNFEANEVQLDTGDRILSFSLEERRLGADPVGGVTWSYVTPGPQSEDVLMLPMREHGVTSELPNMIAVFQVARDEPEAWYRTLIPLNYLSLDLDRVHAEGFGLYREGSQYVLLLPGRNEVPLPGFNVDGRIWEFHPPDASSRYLRVHLFPMSLAKD